MPPLSSPLLLASNMPGMILPQGLCSCCSLCLAVSPSRYPHDWLLHFLQVSDHLPKTSPSTLAISLYPALLLFIAYIIFKADIISYVHLLVYRLLLDIHTHTLECQSCEGGIICFVSLCVLSPRTGPGTEEALSEYWLIDKDSSGCCVSLRKFFPSLGLVF